MAADTTIYPLGTQVFNRYNKIFRYSFTPISIGLLSFKLA